MLIQKQLLEKLIELASDSAEYLNSAEHWITVHPHGSDSKGTHVLVEDGETSKEAVERKFESKPEDKKESKPQQIVFTDAKGRIQSFTKQDNKWFGTFSGKEIKKEKDIINLEEKLKKQQLEENKEKDKFLKDILDYGEAKDAGQYNIREQQYLAEAVKQGILSKKQSKETNMYGMPIYIYKKVK